MTGTIFVGGPNIVFGGRSDWGDATPTDAGFQAQPTTSPDQYDAINAIPPPVLDLQMSYLNDTEPLADLDVPAEMTSDLARTKILTPVRKIDSSTDICGVS